MIHESIRNILRGQSHFICSIHVLLLNKDYYNNDIEILVGQPLHRYLNQIDLLLCFHVLKFQSMIEENALCLIYISQI